MTETPRVLVANAGDGSISVFRVVEQRLERLGVTGGLNDCSTFAVDAARDLVYAAVKGDASGRPAGILTLELDRTTGTLTPRSRLDLPDGGMNYLALAHAGTTLLGAAYSGGYGISCRIDGGVVGEPVSRVTFPNLHSVLGSADGRFAYFVSLGADLVAQYALDDDRRLVPLSPETVSAPTGSGPRHLVLNSANDAVYVVTEFSGEVLHYDRDITTGTLGLRGATSVVDAAKGLGHSVFGADPMANHFIWGADIHWGADEATLWTSERTESTLAASTVGTDGAVTAPRRFQETEPQPRGFALSPDGSLLVAAGERSTTVSLYAVDGDRLELLQRAETGTGANWVRFV
ncbi:lactonase family protein [Microbacterium sp. BR1]|uniref:lactonase family protein n=1 Tax=Microbacterium sp. BR1 TaxID=1070896 RepID=UPI000C2C7338|nr:beta-propeller fold lactonase family protein [Microbacterium sp. BR1]